MTTANSTISSAASIASFLKQAEKKRSPLAPLIRLAAKVRRLRTHAIDAACRFESGPMWSETYRELMLRYYGLTIGRYSYGPCLFPGGLPEGTIVGNYCSFAAGIWVLRRNHPIDRFTQHPFFFNAAVGPLLHDAVQAVVDRPLVIESDVWIGTNAIITPGCNRIGAGAIIGAGAVVTKNVSPFSIVAGIPARPISSRFKPEIAAALLETAWWDAPAEELVDVLPLFLESATLESIQQLREHLQKTKRS